MGQRSQGGGFISVGGCLLFFVLSKVACIVAGNPSCMSIFTPLPSTVKSTVLMNALCGLGVLVETTEEARWH